MRFTLQSLQATARVFRESGIEKTPEEIDAFFAMMIREYRARRPWLWGATDAEVWEEIRKACGVE